MTKQLEQTQDQLIVFQDKQIHRVLHNDERHFSVIGIIEISTKIPILGAIGRILSDSCLKVKVLFNCTKKSCS